MSTDFVDAFSPPNDRFRVYRKLLDILDTTFDPKSPLERPAFLGDCRLTGKPDRPHPLTEVLDELREELVPAMVQARHPWAMAHMVPPPATVSVVADTLIGALNQCAFLWEEGPVAAPLEDAVIAWLNEQVGYPGSAGGLLTSGGTASNLMAAFLAVTAAERRGATRERMCVVASDQSHFSLRKATTLLGLPRDALYAAPTAPDGRLSPGALAHTAGRAVRDGKMPVLIVANVGTTNAGVVEPVSEAVDTARTLDAWSHVDAAHGGFLCLLDDSELFQRTWRRADSLSWDPHKTLYTSYAVGALLVQHAKTLEALRFTSEYALGRRDHPDAGTAHYDGSRRLEALKLWMTIRHLGREGLAGLGRQCVQLAQLFASEVERRTDMELVTAPDTNIICFRYVRDRVDKRQIDTLNTCIQRELFVSGGPLLSTTSLAGRIVLRAVLLNPRLSPEALSDALDRVAALGAQLGREPRDAHRDLERS